MQEFSTSPGAVLRPFPKVLFADHPQTGRLLAAVQEEADHPNRAPHRKNGEAGIKNGEAGIKNGEAAGIKNGEAGGKGASLVVWAEAAGQVRIFSPDRVV